MHSLPQPPSYGPSAPTATATTNNRVEEDERPSLVVLDVPPCIDVDRLPSCESTLSRSGTVYNNRANRVLDGPGCVDLDNLPSSESRLARAGTVCNNKF